MPVPVARLLRGALLATLLGSTIAVVGGPTVVSGSGLDAMPAGTGARLQPAASTVASTAASMGRTVLVLLNRDRVAQGLRPLVADTRLGSLALERARWMAARNVMTHTSAGGTLSQAFRSRRIPSSLSGECVGWTNAAWGSVSARWLYDAWKHSPQHWALMMGSRFTRIGIGFALRSAGRSTYGSLLFARM